MDCKVATAMPFDDPGWKDACIAASDAKAPTNTSNVSPTTTKSTSKEPAYNTISRWADVKFDAADQWPPTWVEAALDDVHGPDGDRAHHGDYPRWPHEDHQHEEQSGNEEIIGLEVGQVILDVALELQSQVRSLEHEELSPRPEPRAASPNMRRHHLEAIVHILQQGPERLKGIFESLSSHVSEIGRVWRLLLVLLWQTLLLPWQTVNRGSSLATSIATLEHRHLQGAAGALQIRRHRARG
eukprot:CAMPEP_0177447154 /NCGR_PEP_ID=MMETSP0369-20130122/7473_1 /TAXON_ID=447022 ORGANISM="Scrippsiella hangoei-like, Strain SHHI-4" /NCGR_SAMPLE_ID=MMETSP0369 /ASSEMBLY_ACC=CAM_ASM_000364 /LENGTH=240 /DNA_ID=CAMNT_0018919441 /DNA_START=94 /DNA_END=811 /DNA_ORIENTATION=+